MALEMVSSEAQEAVMWSGVHVNPTQAGDGLCGESKEMSLVV